MSLLENWSHKFSIFNTSMGFEKRNEAHFLHSEFLLDHRRWEKGKGTDNGICRVPVEHRKNMK